MFKYFLKKNILNVGTYCNCKTCMSKAEQDALNKIKNNYFQVIEDLVNKISKFPVNVDN